MASTLGQIRTAVKTVLEAGLSSFRVFDNWPDTFLNQGAIVVPQEGDYLFTLDQLAARHRMVIVLGISLAGGLDKAQDTMDAYLSSDGTSSIRKVLRANPTLTNIVDDLIVSRYGDYGFIEINSVQYLSAKVYVEFWV